MCGGAEPTSVKEVSKRKRQFSRSASGGIRQWVEFAMCRPYVKVATRNLHFCYLCNKSWLQGLQNNGIMSLRAID